MSRHNHDVTVGKILISLFFFVGWAGLVYAIISNTMQRTVDQTETVETIRQYIHIIDKPTDSIFVNLPQADKTMWIYIVLNFIEKHEI